jgi:hypothetical protein
MSPTLVTLLLFILRQKSGVTGQSTWVAGVGAGIGKQCRGRLTCGCHVGYGASGAMCDRLEDFSPSHGRKTGMCQCVVESCMRGAVQAMQEWMQKGI